ncbi:MAG: OmpA family protein [Polyangiaceae bacterium]|jgi:outer membrane protein OmpA-like peptidoglycan-associated protein/nucleotide-binding universal stress UspA family protein|nr:OmpA family protein [Polyangiaceae bacterium]
MRVRRVVAAVDVSRPAADALGGTADVLTAAAELASSFQAEIVIVHALDDTGPYSVEGDDERAAEVRARLALANGVRALTDAFPDLKVRTSLERAASSWLAILTAAERLDADVVVIGGGRHLRDGVLGSTSLMVANMSRRNVLVVREAQGLTLRTLALSPRRTEMTRFHPCALLLAANLVAFALPFGLTGCGEDPPPPPAAPPPPPQPPPPPPDTDGDGIVDASDKCIDKKEDGQPPDASDGCPTDDPDQDGIRAEADKCPDKPEVVNGYQDEDGCPDEKPVVEVQEKEIKIAEKILFELDSAKIDAKSDKLVADIAKVINEHAELNVIELSGHADDRGTEQYNKQLTQKRADSVMAALVKLGVDKARLRAVGYGKYCPRAQGDDEQAHEQNRRVGFHILMRDSKDTGVQSGGCDLALKKGIKPKPLPAVAAAGAAPQDKAGGQAAQGKPPAAKSPAEAATPPAPAKP